MDFDDLEEPDKTRNRAIKIKGNLLLLIKYDSAEYDKPVFIRYF